jgi:hypothetical protein
MRILPATAAAAVFMVLSVGAAARDAGQWEASDAQVREWYRGVMRPDYPLAPCCGTADAYWSDSFFVDKDGNTVAVVTDPRPDEPLGRPHIEPGTRFIVPNEKLKYDQGNPTGHGVIFIVSGEFVLCYVTPGGV